MIKILYVHGFMGHENGSASMHLRKELDRRGISYTLSAPHVPVTEPEEALKLVCTDEYDVIAGSSMGAFYTMQNRGTRKILVNPALTQTMRDIKGDYPEGLTDRLDEMEEKFFEELGPDCVNETYLVFGTADEVAHNREKFAEHYGESHIYEVKDMPHKLNADGAAKIADIIEEIMENLLVKEFAAKTGLGRLKLLKVAAKAVRSARYLIFKLCSSCPYQKEFYETLSNIRSLSVQLE